MQYKIKQYSFDRAKELGVTIKPSTKKGKKIDVYDNGRKLASIGAKNYNDYPTYLESEGKDFADNRRRLYRERHAKDMNKVGTPGWYANKILW